MKLDEVNWARILPYDRGTEDADFQKDFISLLQSYLLAGDLAATSAILSQIESNYPVIPIDVRIKVCRILYQLVTEKNLDSPLFSKCCTVFSRMLRGEEQLSESDLALEWKPLYNLVWELTFPKIWQDNPVQRRSKLKSVIILVRAANRFFPASIAHEVLREIIPQIQYNTLDWQVPILQILILFLPTRPAPENNDMLFKNSTSNDTPKGPEEWLPTIFSLWSFNLNATSYGGYFMNLVSWIAAEHKGCYKFTDEQVRFVFSSGLQFFNLPIAYGMAVPPRSTSTALADTSRFYRLPSSGALPLSEDKAHAFARFIIYSIHGSDGNGALHEFEQLVQMIEPFYHPSNNGSWCNVLSRFLRNLSKELLQRVRYESQDNCQTPSEIRLTRPLRRRFVVAARTLAMLLLFSKAEDAVSMSHSTLKYLAEVEPDLIFPPLLDILYASVDSVTETHRMISAMRALAKLASSLSNFNLYPEGAQHIAPLLMLTLPGIDVNDTAKTLFALTFICNLCINGVVFNELQTDGDPPSRTPGSLSEEMPANLEEPPVTDMAQIEWATRASTAQFETWIDQYLRRVFALVDNLSSSFDGSDATSTDLGIQNMVSHTTEIILLQCNERYYPIITRLISDFATTISNASAIDGVCKIVYAFANALPEQALRSLLPLCYDRIIEEIENGVGSTHSISISTRSHSETTLVWFLSVFATLTECQDGCYLLPYKDKIKKVIHIVLERCHSRQMYRVGGRILHSTITRLLSTYPERGRSVSESIWNDPEFRNNHFRYWGRYISVEDELEIKWHKASSGEIEFALELLRDVIQPKSAELSLFIDTLLTQAEPKDHDNIQLNKLLTTLRYGLASMGMMVPPQNTSRNSFSNNGLSPTDPLISTCVIDGDDASSMPPHYRIGGQVACGYIFTDSNDPVYNEILQTRESIGNVITKSLQFMTSKREDDVENIKTLIRFAEIFVCDFGADRVSFSNLRRAWCYGIDSFSIDSKKCIIPRYFAVKRVIFAQAGRLLHNARYVDVHKSFHKIVDELGKFCLSSYAEVRSSAVSSFESVVSIFPTLKYPLIPRFLAELDNNGSSDSDRMLGALRVLDTLPIRRACLRNWNYLPMLVIALCRAQHEDKPQFKELIRNTAVSQIVHISPPCPVFIPSSKMHMLIDNLGSHAPSLDSVSNLHSVCIEVYEYSVKAHSELMRSLVDILRDAGTTWRFAAIAGYFLDQLSDINIPPLPELANTLAENLTSDLVLLRESAVLSLSHLLGRIKHRSKTNASDIAVSTRRLCINAEDATFNLHGYHRLCERALAGDQEALNTPYIDNPAAGWFAWPSTIKAYVIPSSDMHMAFDKIDPGSKQAYELVRKVLFVPERWNTIAELFSQESVQPEDDSFGIARAILYTQLFSLFELELLNLAQPALERLVENSERQGAQRAAAELIAGLLRGSKHWSKTSLDKMWSILLPHLNTIFSRLRPDTLRLWQYCLQFSFARRDPRRYLPLVRLLVHENMFDPRSEMPFIEAAKLELLRVGMSCWDWKIASLVRNTGPPLLKALAHPYKQVRDATGHLMYMLASSEFTVSYENVDAAIQHLREQGPTGRDFSSWPGTPQTCEMVNQIRTQIAAWQVEHIPSSEGTSNYSRGGKTLLSFLLSGFYYNSKRVALHYIPNMLSLLASMQEQHDDEDLSRLAKITLQYLSQTLFTTQIAENVSLEILELLQNSSNSWHTITKMLPLLCTLTFSNRFVLSPNMRARLIDSSSSFLVHEQIEVRQSAASALANLIKCASSNVIAKINAQFSQMLSKRLPRVRNGKQPKDINKFNSLVLTRHAGVLGLSCLVLAFPYTIPDWLPDVLVTLAQCIDDPNPIQSTVQRTFAEFRRTHMDTWHEDRKRFTNDQLETLTDMLISPCYYA